MELRVLADLGAVRYLFLLNPLTFVSEALRWAVTPERRAHADRRSWPQASSAWLALFTFVGARAFEKRCIL